MPIRVSTCLQPEPQARVAQCEKQNFPRREAFAANWRMAHEAAGRPAPDLPGELGSPIPRLSERWFCCAEPTGQQLQSSGSHEPAWPHAGVIGLVLCTSPDIIRRAPSAIPSPATQPKEGPNETQEP